MAELRGFGNNGYSNVYSIPILQLLQESIKPSVRSPFDAAFILLHSVMQAHGFKIVGLGEEGNQIGSF